MFGGRFLLNKLFLLIILIPLAEMLILIQVGRTLGFWQTMLLLIFLGFIGVAMVRSQGITLYYHLRREIAQGQVPGLALLDGLLVLFGGILLIIPGFLTDLAGLLLLFPSLRRLARDMLLAWILRSVERRSIRLFIRR